MFSAIASYFTGKTSTAPTPPVPPRIPSPIRFPHPALIHDFPKGGRLPSHATIRTIKKGRSVVRARNKPPRVVNDGNTVPSGFCLCPSSLCLVHGDEYSQAFETLPTPRRPPPDPDTDDEDDERACQPIPTSNENMIVPEKHDLITYLKGAILPRLWGPRLRPEDNVALLGKEGRSGLSVVKLPDVDSNGIELITRIAKKVFKEMVDSYFTNAITRSFGLAELERITDGPESRIIEALTLPASVKEGDISPEQLMPQLSEPGVITDIVEWLVEGPLKTAQRAMHLAHFSARQWGFEPVKCATNLSHDSDQRVFVWKYHPEAAVDAGQDHLNGIEQRAIGADPHAEPSNPISLAVIVMPPWILALGDLEDFVKCRELLPINPTHFQPKERLWSSILDICRELNVSSFILTTYEGWVFGEFTSQARAVPSFSSFTIEPRDNSDPVSESFSTVKFVIRHCLSHCAVSPVYRHSASSPSIMQSLTFWIAQSMKLRFTDGIHTAIAPGPPYTSRTTPNLFENALRSETKTIKHYQTLGFFCSGSVPESHTCFQPAIPDILWLYLRALRPISKQISSSSRRYAPYRITARKSTKT